MNLPNKLTLTRIFLIPVFVAVFFIDALDCRFILSAVVFAVSAFTDFLDGYIARKYNLVTDLGKFLDPIADKILVSTAFIIMLVGQNGAEPILPWYAGIGVAIILARELIVSGFRMIAASKGKVLAAEWSGKIKTTCQDFSIVVLLVSAHFTGVPVLRTVGLVLFGLAVLLTIISGTECLVKNRGVIESK